MDEIFLTGFGFDSSSLIKPNANFEKSEKTFVDDSNRIDFCNLPE